MIIKRADVDLDEIQDGPDEVAIDKGLRGALTIQGPVVVEDVSLCYSCLNGMPGPFIKA